MTEESEGEEDGIQCYITHSPIWRTEGIVVQLWLFMGPIVFILQKQQS